MTAPNFFGVPGSTIAHFYRMKGRAATRDQRMNLIREVREGNMRQMFPDHLSEILGTHGVAVANWVDIVARDLSEVAAPLPALNCAAGSMRTDADKKRAERKNRIGDWYWRQSRLDTQMLYGADWYVSYGFTPFFVEPDYDRKCPVIQIDDPVGSYYELDRFFNVKFYAKSWWRTVDELCAMFPEKAGIIRTPDVKWSDAQNRGSDGWLELVRWVDDKYVTLFLPSRAGVILTQYAHGLGKAPVVIAARPGISMSLSRGQFDDVVYVQLARAIMAGFGLEAAEKSIAAPIALPNDVQELPIGPDAIINTDQPQNVRRVSLDLPPAAFQESQQLYQELSVGSRYPDQRLGQSNASVITGRGVQSLMGGFDTQLKAMQSVFREALHRITSTCFEADEKWFPNSVKTVRGTLSGRSYEIRYTPKKDIDGNYECDVTYGFAAGMQPTQSMVTMLQLRGDALISRDTFRQNMPFDVDPEQEQRAVDVEGMRDALKQGMFAMVQSAGPMIEQGMDPTEMLTAVAAITAARENGVPIEDAAQKAFAKLQEQRQQAAQQAQAEQAQAGAEAGPGGGPGATGLPEGVAPGQAGQPPGGMPALQNLIAGIRGQGATPQLQATVSRRVPVGA